MYDVENINELIGGIGRLTGRAMGLNVTGTFQPCKACLIGKAKKTRICKEPKPTDYQLGKHISIDISSPSIKSRAGKKHLPTHHGVGS
jgi:hypothetical protein